MPRTTTTRPAPAAKEAPPSGNDALQRYRAKRNFRVTPEPESGQPAGAGEPLSFVVQKHHATRLHYDFRLELDGVLLSWAVPKGPSLDPADKRMAVQTEDHPLDYAGFEGTIPAGEYGAGEVIVWDRGSWRPLGDPHAGLEQGKLAFELHGHKLRGQWELVRMRKPDERQPAWLLFKKRDDEARARSDCDVVTAMPDSVLGRAAGNGRAAGAAGAKASASAAPAATATGQTASRRVKPGVGAGSAPPAAAAAPAPRAAVPAPLPPTLSPQLAMLASDVPEQGHWIFENKFDGYRLLTRIEGGVPRLLTRGGHDWTERMPELAAELAALGAGSAWLDGEIVAADAGAADSGRHHFNALQNAFDRGRSQAIVYQVFDLPYFEGHDLRQAPLAARRGLLRQWLQARVGKGAASRVRFSETLGEGGPQQARQLLRQACAAQREGLIAKRDDAPYSGARDSRWLKLKCELRQEFVVCGYTTAATMRRPWAAWCWACTTSTAGCSRPATWAPASAAPRRAHCTSSCRRWHGPSRPLPAPRRAARRAGRHATSGTNTGCSRNSWPR
jgi:bifunctional non-homologous end joining protein LigD